MKTLMITPLPAQIDLCGETALGRLFCNQRFDDVMLENAARKFADSGTLCVTFTNECPSEEYRAYFDDEEGYVLTIAKDGVSIAASTSAGALYGAVTLDLLARQYGEQLPVGVIADKPYWRHRGAQISYAQANVIYKEEYLRHFIRAMAELKINTVYLYLEWRYQFPSIPETHNPHYLSPAQAKAIQDYAKAYNITVVPSLNVIGHTGDFLAMQAFHDLGEYDPHVVDGRVGSSSALCTGSPRMRALVESMLSDIMDAFDCEIIHVGGDEVEALGLCDQCKALYGDKPAGEIYIDYMCWVRDLLKARGRRMGIWSDMLLSFCRKGDPAMLDYAKQLLDHTVIFDWAYDGPHKEGIDLLSDIGADMILSTSVHGCSVAAPWPGQSVNQHVYFADSIGKNIRGGLATDWIYCHGYHGAQMGPLFAASEAMMWQAPDEIFAVGTTAEETYLAYFMQTYGIGQPMMDYFNLAGGGQEDILRHLRPGDKNGSILRRSAYLDDTPLGVFIRYAHLLRGGTFAEFRAAIDRLQVLWDAVEATARPNTDLPYIKGPVILYRYLANKFAWAEELYEAYDRAAKVQYTDPKTFRALLLGAAEQLRSYRDVFDEPLAFLQSMHEELGVEKGSIFRVRATRDNLMLLADFVEHLADGHRPLPSFANMNDYLFDRPKSNFWAPRCDEWYDEDERFVRTDGDNGMPWCAARW
ncbi:MAG: family 20 glycosylhydrolase [Clostridia bacterium]|nr:family 20 glycosylhydrolase [Clostridia bacterium]